MAVFTDDKPNTLAPMGAGSIEKICIRDARIVKPQETISRIMDYQGTLALDGEREIFFKPGDEITCRVSLSGPWRVDVKKAVEYGRKNGFFAL